MDDNNNDHFDPRIAEEFGLPDDLFDERPADTSAVPSSHSRAGGAHSRGKSEEPRRSRREPEAPRTRRTPVPSRQEPEEPETPRTRQGRRDFAADSPQEPKGPRGPKGPKEPKEPKGPRKRHRLRTVLIVVGAVVLALLLTGFFVFRHMYGLMNTKTSATPAPSPTAAFTPDPDATATPAPTPSPTPLSEEDRLKLELEGTAEELIYDEDVYTVLLLGNDTRDASSDQGRSDAMILASINKRTKQLWLTSLMRDSYVTISGAGYQAKLNSALAVGGVETLVATIQDNFGIPIDNYAEVDFADFAKVAELMGGIHVYLTADEMYELNLALLEANSATGIDRYTSFMWDLKDGFYDLDGYQTLAYCRIRHVGGGENGEIPLGDTGRSIRQRNALGQMLEHVKSMNLIKQYKLAETLMSIITTDMTQGRCASLLLSAPTLLTYDLNSQQVPPAGAFSRQMRDEQSVYILSTRVCQAFLRATVFGEDVPVSDLTSDMTGTNVVVYTPPEK